MFEALVNKASSVDTEPDYLIFLDAERQTVGDKMFTNYGTVGELPRGYGTNGANLAHGIVDKSGYGKCFQFSGFVWFGLGGNVTRNLFASNFEIIVDFLPETANVSRTLYSSGNYADASNRNQGILLYTKQSSPANYGELFVDTGGTVGFNRYPGGGAQPTSPDMRDVWTVTKTGSQVSFKSKAGTVNTAVGVIPTADSACAIGTNAETILRGNPAYPENNFRGWIKSMKIRKLP